MWQEEITPVTAQISDTFLFQGEEYSLIGLHGGELTTPEQFGMAPEMMHTACYRGYYATYELTDEGLYLRRLAINEKNDNYLPIEGVVPVEKNDFEGTIYRDLHVKVMFTGELRLAKDFIEELYIHMGYQKPTAFKTVFDVTLKEGQVVEIRDRSPEMAQKRGAFYERYKSGDMLQTIEEAFSLDMELE